MVEWVVPRYTILIQGKNMFVDATTINKILGFSNIPNATFEAKS